MLGKRLPRFYLLSKEAEWIILKNASPTASGDGSRDVLLPPSPLTLSYLVEEQPFIIEWSLFTEPVCISNRFNCTLHIRSRMDVHLCSCIHLPPSWGVCVCVPVGCLSSDLRARRARRGYCSHRLRSEASKQVWSFHIEYDLIEGALHIINVHDSRVCEGELEIKDQRD